MQKAIKVDVCVIGAGAGGLSVAATAAQMGATVALVEAEKMGGDCLNYGCIPSKSLLAAAKSAQKIRDASKFGIESLEPKVDFSKVIASVKEVIKKISTNDSVERFTNLGVNVISAPAFFIDEKTLQAGDMLIHARRFVIATGSQPAIPPIPGLNEVPFYTNESIFDNTKKPEHLMIIGGGPIGCELAQAFALFGVKVSILEALRILPKDEQDLVDILREQLLKDGIDIYENIKITQIKYDQNRIEISLEKEGQPLTIIGSDLLVATGRHPKVSHLNLEAAKVKYTPKGIEVNEKLQTSNKYIFAIGDAIGGYQFTHMANYHAGIVIRNILLRLPAKVNYRAVPWVTYTNPELAHVGVFSEEAIKQDATTKIFVTDFTENDRAQTERETVGKIKIITSAKGKVLGASILGSHAGELLLPWIMVVQEKKSLYSLTNVIIPYPTLNEISKKVANDFYKPMLFSKGVKGLIRILNLLG